MIGVGQRGGGRAQGQGQGLDEDGDCSAVQEVYGSKGFSGHDVPLRMIAGRTQSVSHS